MPHHASVDSVTLVLDLILAPLGVFTLVVLSHELDHFAAARACGVRVLALSVGLGPVMWRRTWGGTEYRLSAIPLGGYVRLAGSSLFDDVTDGASAPDTLRAKSRGARCAIYLAGPAASVVFGVAALTMAFAFGSRMMVGGDSSKVAHVVPGSAAAVAGLRQGDRIAGGDMSNYSAHTWEGVAAGLSEAGGPITLWVDRGGASVAVPVAVPAGAASAGDLGLVMWPAWLVGVINAAITRMLG